MANDYYVRTVSGEYRDDRHHFTRAWKGVSAGEISIVHLEDPKLEVLTAEQYKVKAKKETEPGE